MAKTEKLSRDRKRDLALELYLNTDKTQKEICEIVGWTEKTFTENKEKGEWDAMKGASTITAQNIIKKLYLKLEQIVDNPDGINADALIKVAKSIEFLSNKRVTVSHHINCAKEFTTWLFSKKPELAKELNKYQNEFINQLVSNGQ
jgi:hypothetical protein